jgi:cbb3-type cytochrome oxidase subunit 3
VKSGVKEKPMKKFIYVTVALMLLLMFIGCVATMTPEQRKERYDSREINNLTEGVGNKPFVGSPNNLDARGQFQILTW